MRGAAAGALVALALLAGLVPALGDEHNHRVRPGGASQAARVDLRRQNAAGGRCRCSGDRRWCQGGGDRAAGLPADCRLCRPPTRRCSATARWLAVCAAAPAACCGSMLVDCAALQSQGSPARQAAPAAGPRPWPCAVHSLPPFFSTLAPLHCASPASVDCSTKWATR